MDEQQQLLDYYQRELSYLRRSGGQFAQRYPKIAQRLELSDQESADPHVERLLESFAFLAGRIQYNIDREFPEVPAALLDVLYPHFLAPIPSMTIARFDVDPEKGKLIGGYDVPALTPMFAQAGKGQVLRFRTAFPVTLYPVEIETAALEAADRYDFLDRQPDIVSVLRLRIRGLSPKGNLRELGLRSLRFHLADEPTEAYALYELLFSRARGVALLPQDQTAPRFLTPDALKPVGFETNEAVLPYPANEHQGYRLVQEYFCFPRKFLFFDIDGLSANDSTDYFDILVLLDERPPPHLSVGRHSLALGCTPVINLFSKITDPIRLDETKQEYRLVPDQRLEQLCEVHTILKVSGTSDAADDSRNYQPFFSVSHHNEESALRGGGNRAFWLARRRASERWDGNGTDIFLSFLDLDFNPNQPPDKTVFAHTLCTNRGVAEQLPAGARLSVELDLPVSRITALFKPTRQVLPPLGGKALWRLVSQLSLNHLSLSDGPQSLKALKEILTLYGFTDQAAVDQQIAGLREMACRKVVRRIGQEAWRGFVRGTEVTLTIDERLYTGSSPFLLAAVLNRFFALYASLNSFTQLSVRRSGREGTWKTWPPMAGDQPVL